MFNEDISATAASGEKYRQLESIFSCKEDIQFLQSEPGYHPSIGRRHRAAKRKLAFQWIRALQRDFDTVYNRGSRLLVRSDHSRPDLVRALLRLKFLFRIQVLFLRLRLVCYAPVFHEIRLLTTAFEQMIGYCCIIQHDSSLASESEL